MTELESATTREWQSQVNKNNADSSALRIQAVSRKKNWLFINCYLQRKFIETAYLTCNNRGIIGVVWQCKIYINISSSTKQINTSINCLVPFNSSIKLTRFGWITQQKAKAKSLLPPLCSTIVQRAENYATRQRDINLQWNISLTFQYFDSVNQD